MSQYNHTKTKPQVIHISSITADEKESLNDLEATMLSFQKLIDMKIAEGKKGLVLFKNTPSEYKMSYKKLQAFLWELDTLFSIKGGKNRGICGDCKHFKNSCCTDGCFGYCGDNEKFMFDSCTNFEGV